MKPSQKLEIFDAVQHHLGLLAEESDENESEVSQPADGSDDLVGNAAWPDVNDDSDQDSLEEEEDNELLENFPDLDGFLINNQGESS